MEKYGKSLDDSNLSANNNFEYEHDFQTNPNIERNYKIELSKIVGSKINHFQRFDVNSSKFSNSNFAAEKESKLFILIFKFYFILFSLND